MEYRPLFSGDISVVLLARLSLFASDTHVVPLASRSLFAGENDMVSPFNFK